MGKNILFFGPFKYRARDNESLMLKFRELGHNVFFLNMEEDNTITPFLEKKDIHCGVMNIPGAGKIALLKKVFFLLRFISRHRIDVVFSHLEPANFIAILAQKFTKARIILVRHHSDLFYINGLHRMFSYRYSYKHARNVIAVSAHAKKVMVEKEDVAADKISVINLSYDFRLFDQPDPEQVADIRQKYNYDILLLSVGRLVKNKRFDLSIDVLKKLREKGLDAGLLILGEGELKDELQQKVNNNLLQDHCHLAGFKTNVMDYLAACDILVHPSESESSSVITKEAGIQKKVVIGCFGVGDCDEYIVNGENGFLTDKDNFVPEAVAIITNQLDGKEARDIIGENLYSTIYRLFNVDTNITQYDRFLE